MIGYIMVVLGNYKKSFHDGIIYTSVAKAWGIEIDFLPISIDS